MKKVFLNIFYYLSNTDKELVKNCSHWARAKGTLIGVLILLSSMLAGISMYYFVSKAVGSEAAGIIFATLWFFTVMHIEKSVFLSTSKWAIMVRIVMIVIISFLVSLPLKINLFGKALDEEIKKMQHAEKMGNFQRVANQKAKNSGLIQQFTNELNQLEDQKNKLIRMRDAEANGLSIYDKSTGVAGRGTKYQSLKAQVEQIEEAITTKQRQMDAARVANAENTAREQELYHMQNQGITHNNSFFFKYKAYKRLLQSEDQLTREATTELSLIAYLVMILIEISPVILKSLLPKTDYDHAVEEHQKLIKKAQDYQNNTTMERIHYAGQPNFQEAADQQYRSRIAKFSSIIKGLINNLKRETE